MKEKILEILREFPQVSYIDDHSTRICDFLPTNGGKLPDDVCYKCMLRVDNVLVSIKFDNIEDETIKEAVIKRFKEAGILLNCTN